MKRRIGLLFGGRSAEHDVSLLSARNVYEAIDRTRYDVCLIGITRDGRWWLLGDGPFPDKITCRDQVALVPGGGGELVVLGRKEITRGDRVDLILPVLHGPFGEDGTVQGALVTAGVLFVGSGVLGSAACMDKDVTKRLLRDAGLPVADWISIRRGKAPFYSDACATLRSEVLFVKPARMGSSIGVSRARSQAELSNAFAAAFDHDDKVIVEPFVDARELECAVLERHSPESTLTTSWPGEITTATHHDFYDYEAKYVDAGGASLRTRAEIDPHIADSIVRLAGAAFRALNCRGLARVDFFLARGNKALINEVNTMPGFTQISMYPRMMINSGMSYTDLVTTLIQEALAGSLAGGL